MNLPSVVLDFPLILYHKHLFPAPVHVNRGLLLDPITWYLASHLMFLDNATLKNQLYRWLYLKLSNDVSLTLLSDSHAMPLSLNPHVMSMVQNMFLCITWNFREWTKPSFKKAMSIWPNADADESALANLMFNASSDICILVQDTSLLNLPLKWKYNAKQI